MQIQKVNETIDITDKFSFKIEYTTRVLDGELEAAAFSIKMFINNKLIGKFNGVKGAANSDYAGEFWNSSDIIESERDKGYGKLLLLLAINTSQNLFDVFVSDTRGRTKQQENTYKSLGSHGFITCNMGVCEITEASREWFKTKTGIDLDNIELKRVSKLT